MADVEVSYKGNTIGSLSASGTLTLETEGKYCEDDITVDYTSPGGGGGTTLQTTTVTLTQDYPQATTVGTTLKNLFDAAIGTDFWVAEVSEFPSGKSESDLASVVIRAFKFTSLNAANMLGYDTAIMSSSVTSPGNAAFFRSNSAAYCQGSYPGGTNAKAFSGMKFTIWGWNAS